MSEARINAFGTMGFGLMLGVIVAFVAALWVAVSSLETARWPVTTPAQVYNVRAVDGGSMVAATADKLRGCDWEKTEFRFGPRDGGSVPMPRAHHVDPPQLNVKGDVMVWNNIFLPVPPEQVSNTHWNAYHFCYPVINWQTKTEFFN